MKVKEYAGYRAHRRNKITNNLNVLYDGILAQMDTTAGRWQTVCEEHGAICSHRTYALALSHLSSAGWCEECMAELQRRENWQSESYLEA